MTHSFSSSFLRNKSVLITGGTGSFGKACARKLLEKDECSKVIIFSRDEWKQWQMRESDPIFSHPKIRYFLGDVRDQDRMRRAFNDVNYVIHAAALKQVPAAEYNPSEFIKTNVIGAMNLINAAIDAGVEKVLALSTDKAVNPVNLYGATKLCSDKLLLAGNAYVGKKGTPTFSIVRYGNVLGSRGSLLPYWQSFVQKGAASLPITDARMTRFWITIEEAVEFVLRSLNRTVGGEIFVPKIPSVKIVDLANAFAPKLTHHITGIRPGEKIHEILLSEDEARQAYELDDCYVSIPLIQNKAYSYYETEKSGKKVTDGFVLASNKNSLLLETPDAIAPLIANISYEE
jgi:UDP-N-acetylglucosamine 4,6-dehydratase